MNENTLIASDDILWNDVFENFLDSQNLLAYAPKKNRILVFSEFI